MNVVLPIPDDLAATLSAAGRDLSRRALEAFAIEEYRAGTLSRPDLSRLLGFETRNERDAFLKAHGEYDDITIEDVEQELRTFQRSGI
jgi:hypothetical protein